MRHVGVLPADGLGPRVVVADVAKQLLREVTDGREDAARDDVSLDLGKPDLDLIEPGGVGRREVKMHVREVSEELANALALLSREVVDDDVDLASDGWLATTSDRNAISASGVWRSPVLPMTSPVLVLRAA